MKTSFLYIISAIITAMIIAGFLIGIYNKPVNEVNLTETARQSKVTFSDMKEALENPSISTQQRLEMLELLESGVENENGKMKKRHEAVAFFAFLFAMVILITLMLRERTYHKEADELMDSRMNALISLREELSLTHGDLVDAGTRNVKMLDEIRLLMANEFKVIDRLSDVYFQYVGTHHEKSKIYEEVIGLINSFGSKEKMAELEKSVNSHFDNIIARLRSEIPGLKEWEVETFMLNLLDFSPRAISIFQDITIRMAYGRKAALKRKIRFSETASTNDFLAVLG